MIAVVVGATGAVREPGRSLRRRPSRAAAPGRDTTAAAATPIARRSRRGRLGPPVGDGSLRLQRRRARGGLPQGRPARLRGPGRTGRPNGSIWRPRRSRSSGRRPTGRPSSSARTVGPTERVRRRRCPPAPRRDAATEGDAHADPDRRRRRPHRRATASTPRPSPVETASTDARRGRDGRTDDRAHRTTAEPTPTTEPSPVVTPVPTPSGLETPTARTQRRVESRDRERRVGRRRVAPHSRPTGVVRIHGAPRRTARPAPTSTSGASAMRRPSASRRTA